MIMSAENKKGSTVQDFKDRLDFLDICVFLSAVFQSVYIVVAKASASVCEGSQRKK